MDADGVSAAAQLLFVLGLIGAFSGRGTVLRSVSAAALGLVATYRFVGDGAIVDLVVVVGATVVLAVEITLLLAARPAGPVGSPGEPAAAGEGIGRPPA